MNADQTNRLRDNLRAAYNKYAYDREASTMQDWKIHERANFLALLQAEQKKTFLEIGAGVGRDSKFFQEQGLETVCIDLSPVMVALCRQKGLDAYVMDMGDIQFLDASFDAVYAMNSLLHLPKAEFPSIMRRIDQLLKPGGLFFIGVYGGSEQEGFWEEDDYEPKRFFSFFTDDHLEREVAIVFEIVSFNRVYFKPEDVIHHQDLIVRKRSTAPSAD